MLFFWTTSYLVNQTHIATLRVNEIYRFDEKYIRQFFPVNFLDRYKLKTVATGNFEAKTELNYQIGSFYIFFRDQRIKCLAMLRVIHKFLLLIFISEADFNDIHQQRCLCIITEFGRMILDYNLFNRI